MPRMAIADVHRYLDDHAEDSLKALFDLIRQPSISAQDRGVKECAELLAGMMRERGIDTEVVPTPTQPVVFGRLDSGDPDAFTLICYGHYDVQPPEPLELWQSPPFEPTIRDGAVYGRGTGDNKGQLIAHVLAAEAWRRVAGRPPVNLRFVFEGEEESGSRSLAWFIERHKDRLKADLVYVSDGGMHPSGRPVISLGNRGIQGVTLIARGADRDNHSGNKGGVAPNPVWMLVHVLASMVDPDGRVKVDGFYDGVRPVGERERAMIAELPYDPVELGATMGLPRVDMDAETYYRRIMLEPYFNISGVAAGYVGQGSKTIVPATAECRIDIRLVADQSCEDVLEKVRRHVAAVDPRVEVLARGFGTMQPHRTPPDHPALPAVKAAIQAVRGVPPLIMPCTGGSLPNAVWPRILGAAVIDVPYANADENNHAPNENIRVERFLQGPHISAQVFAELAGMGS
jgi:acetylornithine deacetylase/succinyl-diaminopimelate desuccinylase-like protein